MALGIETNNVAPQLIQNSGAALVQGIRQIGQQISGHLTEMQVKRDLGALAQEMQGLNVQSNEFPIQLAQLTGRHPLAAKDDRAKMLLTPLGAAHAAWQAGEAEARAFNRAMAMQGMRTRDARAEFDYEEGVRSKRPVSVAGVGLVAPDEIDPVTGQAKVLAAAPARGSTALPFASSPGGIYDRRTGQITSPTAPKTSTSEVRLQKKSKIDALTRTDSNVQREIESSIRRRDALTKQRMEITKETDPNGAYLDNTIKAIEEEVATLRKRRTDIRKAIEGIELGAAEMAVDAELGVAPELGAVVAPAAGANVRRVPVLDPNGNPMQLREDQVEAALAAGWKRR